MEDYLIHSQKIKVFPLKLIQNRKGKIKYKTDTKQNYFYTNTKEEK
jgi:hypothetical protein